MTNSITPVKDFTPATDKTCITNTNIIGANPEYWIGCKYLNPSKIRETCSSVDVELERICGGYK